MKIVILKPLIVDTIMIKMRLVVKSQSIICQERCLVLKIASVHNNIPTKIIVCSRVPNKNANLLKKISLMRTEVHNENVCCY